MLSGKLSLAKMLINNLAKMVLHNIPAVETRRPVSELIVKLFGLLRVSLGLAPKDFYADGNYPRLLSAMQRLLVFVSEQDNHYAGQLSQAMLLIHDLVQETRREFPEGKEGDVAWMQYAARTLVIKSKQAH